MTKSNEFELDNEKKQIIANDLGLPLSNITDVERMYAKIKRGMKEQYLAHLIRTLENQLKEITENKFFQIVVQPVPAEDENLEVSCAEYVEKCYFVIYYPENMHGRQLRVQLAHELGHLFLIECFNAIKDNEHYDEKSNTEPLSTLFGLLAIMDKNDYYIKKNIKIFYILHGKLSKKTLHY